MNKNIISKVLILIIIIIIHYNFLIINMYCIELNEILDLLGLSSLKSGASLVKEINTIDPMYLYKLWYYTGEMYSIDISPEILNINSKNPQLLTLKKILLDEKGKSFELFIFNADNIRSYDNILHTIKIVSEIKQVKILQPWDQIDFAEFGACTFLNQNNEIIKANFILVKHAGESDELFYIFKENILFNSEIFQRNIIQLTAPRKLEMKLYSIRPNGILWELFKRLTILIKRNQGLTFCVVYDNREGFVIEAYDRISHLQWYLSRFRFQFINFVKVRKEFDDFIELPDIKKEYPIYLKSFIYKWNLQALPYDNDRPFKILNKDNDSKFAQEILKINKNLSLKHWK